jgi:hypothetical protein
MRFVLAAALTLALPDPPIEDFYKFKAGTSWTYKRVEDAAERKITATVTGEENGKVRLEWKDPDKDGTSIVTWSVTDGALTVEAKKEGQEGALSFAVLKAFSKKDDTWPGTGGEFTHRGTTEVSVPAGTYKDAVWTRLRTGQDGELTIDFYLVPNVGLVKVEIDARNGGNTFELAEFKDAKK